MLLHCTHSGSVVATRTFRHLNTNLCQACTSLSGDPWCNPGDTDTGHSGIGCLATRILHSSYIAPQGRPHSAGQHHGVLGGETMSQ